MLTQNSPIISYESTKLKENEHNYVTHDMFLIAIIHPLKMWRHYLMGKKFELRTDHDGLKYLFEHTTLNARQGRWMDVLCEYEFDIKHIKGKENNVVDSLNRKIHVMYVVTISTVHQI